MHSPLLVSALDKNFREMGVIISALSAVKHADISYILYIDYMEIGCVKKADIYNTDKKKIAYKVLEISTFSPHHFLKILLLQFPQR